MKKVKKEVKEVKEPKTKKSVKKNTKKWEYMAVIEDLNRRNHTCLFTCSYRLNTKENIHKNIEEWKQVFNGNFQAMTFLKELREVK